LLLLALVGCDSGPSQDSDDRDVAVVAMDGTVENRGAQDAAIERVDARRPGEEVCNLVDDDLDGRVDEGFTYEVARWDSRPSRELSHVYAAAAGSEGVLVTWRDGLGVASDRAQVTLHAFDGRLVEEVLDTGQLQPLSHTVSSWTGDGFLVYARQKGYECQGEDGCRVFAAGVAADGAISFGPVEREPSFGVTTYARRGDEIIAAGYRGEGRRIAVARIDAEGRSVASREVLAGRRGVVFRRLRLGVQPGRIAVFVDAGGDLYRLLLDEALEPQGELERVEAGATLVDLRYDPGPDALEDTQILVASAGGHRLLRWGSDSERLDDIPLPELEHPFAVLRQAEQVHVLDSAGPHDGVREVRYLRYDSAGQRLGEAVRLGAAKPPRGSMALTPRGVFVALASYELRTFEWGLLACGD